MKYCYTQYLTYVTCVPDGRTTTRHTNVLRGFTVAARVLSQSIKVHEASKFNYLLSQTITNHNTHAVERSRRYMYKGTKLHSYVKSEKIKETLFTNLVNT